MASSDGGSFEEGAGGPDEGEGDPGGLSADERSLRGWLPPDERTWRHPSELGPWAAAQRVGGGAIRTRPPGRRTAWATSLVGAGAVAALVTGGLMLATGPRGDIGTPAKVTAPPASALQSIVRLEVVTSTTNTYGCGVAVAPGGMIATDATLLAGAARIVATDAAGRRERATVVALDPTSDVGIVHIAVSLPVARFVDWSQVQRGTGAVELAVATVSSGSATSMWADETVDSAGGAVGAGPGTGMVSVVADTPQGISADGAVLMERDGAVLGLLDKSGVPADGGGAVFLPGEFVGRVAQELMSDGGTIHHGWLGIDLTDPSTHQPAGALVTAVDPSGASNGVLRPGEVITAIDGRRVRSMADLKSRLYMLAPGTRVTLRVDSDGTEGNVGLWLGSSS